MKKINGITLIELLITILILSILAGVAGPSFLDSFKKRKLISAAEQLYSNLQLARSESLTRSVPIYFKIDNLTTANWVYGISTIDCDPKINSNVNASACTLFVDDGDGDNIAANDNILMRVDGSEQDEISMRLYYATGWTNTNVIFDPARGTTNWGRNFRLSNSNNDAVVVKVDMIGNIKICSDDLSDYRECNL